MIEKKANYLLEPKKLLLKISIKLISSMILDVFGCVVPFSNLIGNYKKKLILKNGENCLKCVQACINCRMSEQTKRRQKFYLRKRKFTKIYTCS